LGGKLGAGRINALKAVETVSPPPPPVADFSGSPTTGDAPLTVTFSDSSTGSVYSWAWDFGDGGTSSAQNPAHTYTAAGTYNVSLAVTGPGGTDSNVKTGYITVSTPPPAPIAEFSASPRSGGAPLFVNFSDLSTGGMTYSWNFGDSIISADRDPWHEYSAAGSYTVSLTVTGPGGQDTETKANFITVTELYQAGVTSLGTGIYSGRGIKKSFHPQEVFSRGDEVVFRASVEDAVGPLSGAVVAIEISGPVTTTITSGPSDNNGIAEAKWKTSAPNRKNGAGGTSTGSYTATVTNVTATGYVWDWIPTTKNIQIN
jgi:PKD repeat protein